MTTTASLAPRRRRRAARLFLLLALGVAGLSLAGCHCSETDSNGNCLRYDPDPGDN